MEAHPFHTPRVKAVGEWTQGSAAVTLRVSANDARRIVRALEETSVRLSGSPSGSQLAGSYIRLAGIVREQTQSPPPIELAG
jgi:hypothetical protein